MPENLLLQRVYAGDPFLFWRVCFVLFCFQHYFFSCTWAVTFLFTACCFPLSSVHGGSLGAVNQRDHQPWQYVFGCLIINRLPKCPYPHCHCLRTAILGTLQQGQWPWKAVTCSPPSASSRGKPQLAPSPASPGSQTLLHSPGSRPLTG